MEACVVAAKPRSGPAKSASAAVSNNSNRTSSRSGNPVVVCAKQECLQRTAANDIPAQISAPPQNFQSPPSAPPVYQPPRTYPDLEVISPAAEPTLAQNQEAIPTDAIPESSANMYSALNMLMTPPETEMSVATSGDSVPPETVSETTAPSAPIGDEEEAALLYSDDEEESEYGNITESGTEETPGKQKIRSRRKALLEHPPFEQIGPLKFYDLPRASIAGLKSLLKMDATVGAIMSAVMIIAFAIVGDTHQRLGVGLAAATKAAISFAIISALSSFLNSLFAILMFFNYHKDRVKSRMAPRLAVVKSCAAIASITTALLTCLLACLSSDSETGLALLALSSGLVTAPIYAAFFVMEVYSLLIRPNMLARNGMVPLLDEDVDVCCGNI